MIKNWFSECNAGAIMIDLDIGTSSKKQQCKQLMLEIFGPRCAARVDDMTEEECIDKCKDKVRSLLGDHAARQFECFEHKQQAE